jgi:hypothetical protein
MMTIGRFADAVRPDGAEGIEVRKIPPMEYEGISQRRSFHSEVGCEKILRRRCIVFESLTFKKKIYAFRKMKVSVAMTD